MFLGLYTWCCDYIQEPDAVEPRRDELELRVGRIGVASSMPAIPATPAIPVMSAIAAIAPPDTRYDRAQVHGRSLVSFDMSLTTSEDPSGDADDFSPADQQELTPDGSLGSLDMSSTASEDLSENAIGLSQDCQCGVRLRYPYRFG